MYQELELCRHFVPRQECRKCNKKRNRISHLISQYENSEEDDEE